MHARTCSGHTVMHSRRRGRIHGPQPTSMCPSVSVRMSVIAGTRCTAIGNTPRFRTRAKAPVCTSPFERHACASSCTFTNHDCPCLCTPQSMRQGMLESCVRQAVQCCRQLVWSCLAARSCPPSSSTRGGSIVLLMHARNSAKHDVVTPRTNHRDAAGQNASR